MFLAALVASHHNPHLKIFADRLRDAGKPQKVIITAVVRKLVTIVNALLKSQQNWSAQTDREIQLLGRMRIVSGAIEEDLIAMPDAGVDHPNSSAKQISDRYCYEGKVKNIKTEPARLAWKGLSQRFWFRLCPFE